MQSIRGDRIRIALFEGTAQEVVLATDRWFEGQGMMAEVIDIEFNYQGPEYDGSKKLTEHGTHGVLIVFKPMTINEVRREYNLEEVHHGAKEEVKHPYGY